MSNSYGYTYNWVRARIIQDTKYFDLDWGDLFSNPYITMNFRAIYYIVMN